LQLVEALMNKQLILMSMLLFWFATVGHGQTTNYALKFIPTFNNQPLQLYKAYYLPNINDSITIEGLRFYVSGVKLLKGDKVVHELVNGYYLVDATIPETQSLELDLPKPFIFDQIQLHIGIDSITNVSGAMGGALDPMNGMYWAWQSGFINFKLEGTSPVCNSRNHKFQYHIGGYMPPFNALQTVTFSCTNDGDLTVYIALDKILGSLDLKLEPEIMSPSAKAISLSTIIKQNFTTNIQP
jgi:hypothetical protein